MKLIISLSDMEELKKFQSSTFDTIARRRSVDDQNTLLELSGRVQELENEIKCMNDAKRFSGCRTLLYSGRQATTGAAGSESAETHGCPTDPVPLQDRGCASGVVMPGANHPDNSEVEPVTS